MRSYKAYDLIRYSIGVVGFADCERIGEVHSVVEADPVRLVGNSFIPVTISAPDWLYAMFGNR